jgi:hypothetical protein
MSMKQATTAGIVLGLAAVLAPGYADSSAKARADKEEAEFKRLHSRIRPQRGESRWAELPWMTNFHEARKKAAREGKLMAVWSAGGGHPLGFV